ncbi:hypothetical protein H5410_043869 [Solanum commersonii]|uniref:Uncharacterized protein n=1 Tax=Solanum commersonii TaxID=4109 RepID=A0A9J5XYD9_SOLCO|nr:hypothetical protein H5410_043869 [Solanum commersonii]
MLSSMAAVLTARFDAHGASKQAMGMNSPKVLTEFSSCVIGIYLITSSLMGTSQINYPLDNGKYNEDKGLQETFISKRKEDHAALTEGHVVALIQKMGPDLIKEQLGLLGLLKNNKESRMKEVQCLHTSKIPEAEPFIDNILGQEATPSPRPCLSEEELGMLESLSPGTLECVKERGDGSVEGENRLVAIIEEFGGGESFNYSDKETGPRGDEGAGQLTNFEEPLPLQINDSLSEQKLRIKLLFGSSQMS